MVVARSLAQNAGGQKQPTGLFLQDFSTQVRDVANSECKPRDSSYGRSPTFSPYARTSSSAASSSRRTRTSEKCPESSEASGPPVVLASRATPPGSCSRYQSQVAASGMLNCLLTIYVHRCGRRSQGHARYSGSCTVAGGLELFSQQCRHPARMVEEGGRLVRPSSNTTSDCQAPARHRGGGRAPFEEPTPSIVQVEGKLAGPGVPLRSTVASSSRT